MSNAFNVSQTSSCNRTDTKKLDRNSHRKSGNDLICEMKSNSSEAKLHDIEEQLGVTENRCNTLKEQLSYMKKYCIDVRKYENSTNLKSGKAERTTYTIINDQTDPNVRTINNILTGLSNSVNRLSALHTDIDSKQGIKYEAKKEVKEIGCGLDLVTTDNHQDDRNIANLNKQYPISKISGGEEDNARDCSNANIVNGQSNKKRLRLKQSKITKITSCHSPKTKNKDKFCSFDKVTSSSTTTHKRAKIVKRYNKFKIQSKDIICERPSRIVELYHNNKAVSKSDSDDSCHRNKQSDELQLNTTIPLIPNSTINCVNIEEDSIDKMYCCPNQQQSMTMTERPQLRRQLSRIGENDQCDNTVSVSYMRNYEFPTIASKLKQVAKGYMRGFDFRTIPFCAARSTSPSHNIGLNIQQVMNIMKTRQPLNGISPTLAHNIGIAADKLHNNPLSAIVSTLSSKLGIKHGRAQCPLTRYHSYNYHQMQDMAKETPDEPCIGDAEDDGNNRQKNGIFNYSGPCGDNEAQQYSTIWTVDPTNQRNCTCVQYDGLAFEQVYNKYSTTPGSRSSFSFNYGKTREGRIQRYKRLRNSLQFNRNNVDVNSNRPLRGKEKTLKEVLENLHNEFEQLNNKYESLNKQVNLGLVDKNNETMEELTKLESDVNKKENEIKMVMDLYNEVTTLKEQVKTLKEKASSGSIAGSTVLPSTQFRRDREQNTVLHLTKLLRQIQQYQGLYK